MRKFVLKMMNFAGAGQDLLCAREDFPLHKLLSGAAAEAGEAEVTARWLM